MKGLFVGRGYRHTDDVKNNTHQNNRKKDQKGGKNAAAGHYLVRNEGNRSGNGDGNQKDCDDPANRFIPLLFR